MVDLRPTVESMTAHYLGQQAPGSPPALTPLPGLTPEALAAGYTPEQAAGIETAEALEIVSIMDLKTPPRDDPEELLKHRFLCRGGVLLLVGPTGVGKSSWNMQAVLRWADGREHFDIRPARPLSSVIIQAENDEGDMAEMRDGVIRGLNLTPADAARLRERVWTVQESGLSREAFVARAGQILRARPGLDLVVIDPAFAYLGGDALAARDVSHFMRQLLLPLARRHGVGVILVHHTNKPLAGKEKSGWAAGDFAYLGAGSAEWINAARACLALRSVGSETLFELRAPKRGRRLGWIGPDGEPTTRRYIAHHREPGVICWRDAEADEVAALTPPAGDKRQGGKPGADKLLFLLIQLVGPGEAARSRIAAGLKEALDCSDKTAQTRIGEALEDGVLEVARVEAHVGRHGKQFLRLAPGVRELIGPDRKAR